MDNTGTAHLRAWLVRTAKSSPAGARLPTARDCARRFGLSLSSVRRVFSEFRRDGALVSVRGKGTFVHSVPQPQVAPRRTDDAAARLTTALTGLIAAGDLRHGDPLPSHTYVVRRFRVTPRTVTAAYAALVRRGLATRVGRRHWVGQLRSLVRSDLCKEVLLLTCRAGPPREFFHDDHLGLALGKMEIELQHYGYRLRAVPLDQLERIRHDIADGRWGPQGFVFYDVADDEAMERRVRHLRHAYRSQRRMFPPILAVTSAFLTLDPRIVVVNAGHIATTQARDCARWLVESGRMRATVFIDTDDRTLAFERLLKIAPELLHLQPSANITFAIRSPRAGTTPRTVLSAAGAVRDWRWVRAMMNRYEPFSDERIMAFFRFVPSLRQAFGRSMTSDIWLFPHTATAVEALEWLARASGEHSRTPGVAVFDNLVYTRHKGISCCVPDWDRLGYLMAHALVGDIPIERSRHGFVHCSSLVLRRETAG